MQATSKSRRTHSIHCFSRFPSCCEVMILMTYRPAPIQLSPSREKHIELGIIFQAQLWKRRAIAWGLHLRAQVAWSNPTLLPYMREKHAQRRSIVPLPRGSRNPVAGYKLLFLMSIHSHRRRLIRKLVKLLGTFSQTCLLKTFMS